MQSNQKITPAILAAACGMLQPFFPELTPQGLLAILKDHAEKPANGKQEKALTPRETAALLSVSRNTVSRYLSAGILKSVRIGPRLIRVDPASVRELLAGGIENE